MVEVQKRSNRCVPEKQLRPIIKFCCPTAENRPQQQICGRTAAFSPPTALYLRLSQKRQRFDRPNRKCVVEPQQTTTIKIDTQKPCETHLNWNISDGERFPTIYCQQSWRIFVGTEIQCLPSSNTVAATGTKKVQNNIYFRKLLKNYSFFLIKIFWTSSWHPCNLTKHDPKNGVANCRKCVSNVKCGGFFENLNASCAKQFQSCIKIAGKMLQTAGKFKTTK